MFDPENEIVQLCGKAIELEGAFPEKAALLFGEAWELAQTDFEKCVAAHYLARHQHGISEKLDWDLRALAFAEAVRDGSVDAFFPSLLLNVGKGFEDSGDNLQARNYYERGLAQATLLPQEAYGSMIRGGLEDGLRRIEKKKAD